MVQSCLNGRGRSASPPVEVVLAVMELEACFLAALASLRGQRGVRTDAQAPSDPESVRGAKEALRRQMTPGSAYSSPTDQPALAAVIPHSRQRHPGEAI